MLCDFTDITDRLGEPLWWDQHGVPRYDPFIPEMLGVYDKFALLVRIECQSCRKPMRVGCGWYTHTIRHTTTAEGNHSWEVDRHSLRSLAENFRFSDPPRHGCGGDCMNSAAMKIEEAWEHGFRTGWVRYPEVENVDVRPSWDADRESWRL